MPFIVCPEYGYQPVPKSTTIEELAEVLHDSSEAGISHRWASDLCKSLENVDKHRQFYRGMATAALRALST